MSPLRGSKQIVKDGESRDAESAGPDGVAEGAGRQAPMFRGCAYCRRPIFGHGEGRRTATVDVVMMQFDTSGVRAFIDEMKETRERILAA
jgi:hypothetical protein